MREVRITDTLSGEKRAVEPGADGRLGIYACGPTTYGPIHIGNARPFVVPMLLARFLRREGHDPVVAINLTDVNDKIYAAAKQAGVPSAEWAERMIAAYVADTDQLGIGRPDHEPKATETMPAIVALIEALIEGGHAYESGGDVYFRVRSFDRYGALSNRDPERMDQGEEAGAADLKEAPLDFALWKRRKEGEDTFWPSPWGDGRPGWHIECSAMAEELLGLEFAIHGGGSDLVFPHHENEIAQTEAARGKPLAKIWMHNGMVQAGATEKMSKSLGNIFLLGEAIEAFGGPAVIRFLVSGHYRQPIAFGETELQQAVAANERVREFFREEDEEEGERERDPAVQARLDGFCDALADDFNTPRALAELSSLISDARGEPLSGAHTAVREMLELLGLEALAESEHEAIPPEADELLAERGAAREAKDWARADEIRDRLAELGWEVRDEAGGARLVRR